MTPGPDPHVPEEPDEAEQWRAIVENYGERVELDEPAVPEPETAPVPPPAAPGPSYSEEHFVPPEPPAVGWPRGPRALACVGLFVGPLLILTMMVVKVTVPTWLGWLALFAFIGGFGYLVASVRERDDWDDGSQV